MSTYEAIKYNFTGANVTNLNGSNVSAGTVPSARLSLSASDIPNLDTAKITSGTFDNARLSSSSVTQHVDLTSLSASNLTSGTIPNARYGTPTFSASNLTSLPAPTTAQVTSSMAGATAGSTGTFAMMYDNQAQTRVLGGTTAGTNLRWGAGGGSWDGLDWNRNPSGTWRCVGFSMNSGASNRVTCWLRIS